MVVRYAQLAVLVLIGVLLASAADASGNTIRVGMSGVPLLDEPFTLNVDVYDGADTLVVTLDPSGRAQLATAAGAGSDHPGSYNVTGPGEFTAHGDGNRTSFPLRLEGTATGRVDVDVRVNPDRNGKGAFGTTWWFVIYESLADAPDPLGGSGTSAPIPAPGIVAAVLAVLVAAPAGSRVTGSPAKSRSRR